MTTRPRVLAAVAELAGRPEPDIDPTARFSALGLDSRATTALVARLAAELDRPLHPTTAWDHPTVDELAHHLDGGRRSARAAVDVPVDEPVAIVGMACRFPGAPGLDEYWRLLLDGRDAVGEAPPGRWDRDAGAGTRWGGFLDGVDRFDPQFFGISPREAAAVDPQQRLVLELAWTAVEDSGVDPLALRDSDTGVFTAALWNDYARRAGPITQHTATGEDLSIIAARVSYTLGLRGPSLGVTTACSGALVAVHLACQSLRLRESALALAGGVNLVLAPESGAAMAELGALSPRGRSRAFDAGADGYVRAEGGGLVVLKRLDDALADGDRVYCVVRGSAVNNDGFSNGLTAPNPRAQEDVLRRACARAGVDPGRVDYVEAHGTGTPLGDPIELGALGRVLGAGRPADRPLLVGSVKTNIGHTEAAAGAAGLIKAALVAHHRVLPPTLHQRRPNPDIDFTGVEVVDAVRELRGPVVAGVSSFGFGGTNCHVVIEGPPARERAADVFARLGPATSPRPRVVFAFAGQGAQWAGMGRDLLRDEPVFRAAVADCAAVFAELGGTAVLDELRAADETRLGRSTVLQPLVFSVQVGLVALWRSWGVVPDAVLGHSLGEVAAAHTAGLLGLRDAVRVVHHRSALMARLDGTGAVALVALDVPAAERVAAAHGVAVAAENGPLATVLAGDPAALAACLAALRADGVECHEVGMGVAAHTAHCDPLLPELAGALAGLTPRPGAVPFYSTVTGQRHDQPLDAAYWQRNLRDRVRFAPAVRALGGEPPALLEIGPHPVLGRALAEITGRPVSASLRRGEPHAQTLRAAATELHALGVDLRVEPPADRPRLLALSAHTERANREQASAVADLLEAGADLDALAATAAAVRGGHRHRLAVVARDRAEAVDLLRRAGSGGAVPRRRAGLAFVFSGQGTQWTGMGTRLLAAEPVFRRALERHDETVRELAGWSPLAELRGSRLAETAIAQPVLCAVQLALAELWGHWGVRPDAVAGHSVGEIAAACVAGALTPAEALRVAVERGRVMGRAPAGGRMVSVALPAADLPDLGARVGVAAVNSPQDTVIAGDGAAMEAVLARLPGVRTRELAVDYAFHSPLMDPFRGQLAARLTGLAPTATTIPLVSTVTGGQVEGDRLDGEHWDSGIRQTVRFADAVAALESLGCRDFVELGPHPALGTATARGLAEPGLVVPTLRRDDDLRTPLLSLAALWTAGHATPPATPGPPARLPEYPWQRERHWLAPAPTRLPDLDALAARHDLTAAERALLPRLAAMLAEPDAACPATRYVIRWEHEDAPRTAAPRSGHWLLVGDGDRTKALADHLTTAGGAVAVVAPGPGCETDLDRALADGRVRAAVLVESGEDGDLPAAVSHVTGTALVLTQRLAARPGRRLWLAPSGNLAGAALTGFGAALAHEHPELWGGVVEADSPAALAEALVGHDGEDRVVLRDGRRLVARLAPAPAARPPALALDPEAAYLVTGGFGGIGLVLARHLLRRGARRLVLVGRREPAAAVLDELGDGVVAVQADVSRRADVERVLADLRRDGVPLRGVVHAAGVLDDGIAVRLDRARLDRVLAPKAAGAWHLHELTAGSPLDFFVLFSSYVGTLGAPGQSGYAAANAVLDALATHRRAAGLPAASIGWGPWRDTGMTAGASADRQRWQDKGLTPLEHAAALRAFDHAAAGATEPHELVLDVDWAAHAAGLPGRVPPLLTALVDSTPPDTAPDDGRLSRALETAHPDDRADVVADHVAHRVAEALGLPDPARLDREAGVFDLGMDSQTALALAARLSRDLGAAAELPATTVLDHPTVTALAAHLADQLAGDDLAAVLDEIEGLSDEQVAARLAALDEGGTR
ncbi:type I polyketide synthase [Actinokineospora sp. G85]|uniref:type I polyketide synthase n=1 Tax=Actinokineospora sp. G85 TaxID=3406626 RepID=UPI003C74849A